MADKKQTLSRRRLLERTGVAALGLMTGAACADGEAPPVTPSPPATPGPAPTPPNGAPPVGGDGATPQPPGPGNPPQPPVAGSDGNPPQPRPPGNPPQPPAQPPGQPPAGGDDAGEPMPVGVPVALVRNGDLDAAVARAVELAGGIDEIQPGQSVFIKPNAVSDRAIGTPGIRTSNEVLAAVVRLVKARNPGRIVVGDRAARGFDSTAVFESTGMAAAAMAAGADEIYAAPIADAGEDDHWALVQPPNYEEVWAGAGGLLVMRRIQEADHLINVPTLKNHRFALFSLSLKNFVGGIGDSSRDPLHYLSSIGQNFQPLGRDIALLNQPFAPLINVVDGTAILVNGGPQGDGSDAVRVSGDNLIVAGKDRVALDTVGVAILRHEIGRTSIPSPDASQTLLMGEGVWSHPQITNSIELGLGIATPDEGRLSFDGIADDEANAIEAIWRAVT